MSHKWVGTGGRRRAQCDRVDFRVGMQRPKQASQGLFASCGTSPHGYLPQKHVNSKQGFVTLMHTSPYA
eukprot:1158269-Pelagomonas_calceolata.AAC.6